MHIITVSVTFLQKIQLLMILKKSLLTELEKKNKKTFSERQFFWGGACFGWVGRSTANQRFLRSVRALAPVFWSNDGCFNLHYFF